MSRRRKGFWDSFPQAWWVEGDWKAWEKAGRPRVPVELRLGSPIPKRFDARPPVVPERLDTLPVVDPPGGLFGGFDLYAPGRPKGQSARSAAIDGLLDKLGVSAKRDNRVRGKRRG